MHGLVIFAWQKAALCSVYLKLRRYLLCIRTKDFVIVGYHETFLYSGIGGPGAVQLQKSAKAPRPCAWGVRPPGPHLRASARSDRTAREHEALMARNVMSKQTEMQNKYCGPCCRISISRHASHLCFGICFGRGRFLYVVVGLLCVPGSNFEFRFFINHGLQLL